MIPQKEQRKWAKLETGPTRIPLVSKQQNDGNFWLKTVCEFTYSSLVSSCHYWSLIIREQKEQQAKATLGN